MEVCVEKNWLMDYQILRLVSGCQRLIKAEFGDKPSLSNPRLREELADYAGRTRQRRLQQIYAELRLALIDLEGEDELGLHEETAATEADRPRRMYRGRPVAVDEAPLPDSGASERPESSDKVLMYRGRPVGQT
jgi:hypothetical protein